MPNMNSEQRALRKCGGDTEAAILVLLNEGPQALREWDQANPEETFTYKPPLIDPVEQSKKDVRATMLHLLRDENEKLKADMEKLQKQSERDSGLKAMLQEAQAQLQARTQEALLVKEELEQAQAKQQDITKRLKEAQSRQQEYKGTVKQLKSAESQMEDMHKKLKEAQRLQAAAEKQISDTKMQRREV